MLRTFEYSSIVIIIKKIIYITVYVSILLEKVYYFKTYIIIMPVCPHDHIILCYIYLRIIDDISLIV